MRQGAFRHFVHFAAIAVLVGVSVGMLAGLAPCQAQAQQSSDQKRGKAPLRIAIIILASTAGDDDIARELAQVVTANLGRDRQLLPIDSAGLIDKITDPNFPPRFTDWRALDAQALLIGRIGYDAAGRLSAQFRLWDVAAGIHLFGRMYSAATDSQGLLAKEISKEIYERLTGKQDAFD